MLKEFLLFIKYPYTAGVIVTIWLGSALMLAVNQDLPLIKIVIINMLASVFIAYIGFGGKQEI